MNVAEAAAEADRRANVAAVMVARIAEYRMVGLFFGVTPEQAIRSTPWPTVAVGYDGWTGGYK